MQGNCICCEVQKKKEEKKKEIKKNWIYVPRHHDTFSSKNNSSLIKISIILKRNKKANLVVGSEHVCDRRQTYS
jgi:hypothetical protein